MRSRRFCRSGFAAFAAFCLFAPLHNSSPELFAQETKIVRIGYSALSLSFLTHLFARDAGIFKKHRLEMQMIQMAGPIQVAALAAGEIDFGAAVSPALFAAVRGLPLRAVMITVKTPLFYIVAQPSVQRIDQLAGKKVAVDTIGALQYIAARAMLKRKGVNPDQVSYIQTGSVSNSVTALGSGSVNAALLSTPHNVVMTQKGFNLLISASEAEINFPPAGLSVHSAKLKKEAPQIRRVIEALLDAQARLGSGSSAISGYIERQWKLSARLAEDTLREVTPTLVPNGRLPLEAVQEFLDAAYENGQIQQRGDAKTLMDYGPLDDVLKIGRAK
jgi:NitT/TauT family transport system substrate-binding protein